MDLLRRGQTCPHELARLIGASQATVAHWCNRRRWGPSGNYALRTARALGVTVEYLLAGEGNVPTTSAVQRAVNRARSEHRARQEHADASPVDEELPRTA